MLISNLKATAGLVDYIMASISNYKLLFKLITHVTVCPSPLPANQKTKSCAAAEKDDVAQIVKDINSALNYGNYGHSFAIWLSACRKITSDHR